MKITDKFVFFWDGEFSNWFPCKFRWNGQSYNCSEQAMMWAKAFTFGDMETANKIMKATSPRSQKALGRQIKDYDDKHWSKLRFEIVVGICMCKFAQNPDLLKILIDTGDRTIVEASPYDKIWGIGMNMMHPDIEDPSKWQGQNLLGKVLMRCRELLQIDLTKEPI